MPVSAPHTTQTSVPLGFYRTDALLGTLFCMNLDPHTCDWDDRRITIVDEASWTMREKSPWRHLCTTSFTRLCCRRSYAPGASWRSDRRRSASVRKPRLAQAIGKSQSDRCFVLKISGLSGTARTPPVTRLIFSAARRHAGPRLPLLRFQPIYGRQAFKIDGVSSSGAD